jgi:hypothetical protein
MNRTSIHLNPDSVQIEVVRNGQRSLKNTNIQAIQEVLTRGERMETPLLPFGWGVQKYTKVNNREQYVIATPQARHKASFDMRAETGETGENRYPKFEIVAPAALWIIHAEHNPATDGRRYLHGVAYALKQQVLSLNDQLYRFPFANTNSSYICWGTERDYPALAGSKSLMTIPDRFFNNPFNNDLDGGKYRPFHDEVNGHRITRERTIHLLQHMDKEVKAAEEKGEQYRFNNDILIEEGMRLGEAIEHWSRQYLNR